MPRFSLIAPTLGRTAELSELLASIINQNRNDIEIVIVDQNEDERILPLLAELPKDLSVLHLRLKEKNVSAARNAGMDAATGEIIAFPDDDCYYPPDLLNQVDAWFRENPRYSVMAVGALDHDGVASGNRWLQDACDIGALNVLRTTFCSSLFISDLARSREVRFDLQLNRGEARHTLARWLFFANRGEFRDGDLNEIMNKTSCLSLLSNAAVVWNTARMQKIVDQLRGSNQMVRDEDLARIWPLLHQHILPTGIYDFASC